MCLDLTDDESTLLEVMAWCRPTPSHYPGQCLPRSMTSLNTIITHQSSIPSLNFITVTSWRTRWRVRSTATLLFAQPFVQAQIKENIKAPRHRHLWGESTGDRWIPLTKGQLRGKCFYLMTSSWRLSCGHQFLQADRLELMRFTRGIKLHIMMHMVSM